MRAHTSKSGLCVGTAARFLGPVAPLNAMANPSYHPWDVTLELASHAGRMPKSKPTLLRRHSFLTCYCAFCNCSLLLVQLRVLQIRSAPEVGQISTENLW